LREEEKLLAKAARYLRSAKLLADNQDLDSAVSRIYYASFYTAEALLGAGGLSFSSHRGVISAFGQHFAKTGELEARFHRLLIEAFEKRQMGDYLTETPFTLAEVEELLENAHDFLSAAKERLGY
jgi:uncharacterized protein (UPF0332 family)